MSYLEVKQVTFYPEGEVVFDYSVLPDDVRTTGIAKTHGVMVTPQGDALEDLLEELRDHAERALSASLERFEEGEPEEDPVEEAVRVALGDDEDEPSPYDNPEEREVE